MSRGHWLDELRNVRLLWRLFIALLALTVLAELAVSMHPQFGVDGVFAFHAIYGLLACVAMIGIAKALGAVLKRSDRYYEVRDE
jgi:hypothetical protein